MNITHRHLQLVRLALLGSAFLFALSALFAWVLPVGLVQGTFSESQPAHRDLSSLHRVQARFPALLEKLFVRVPPIRVPNEWLEVVAWDRRPPREGETRRVVVRLLANGEIEQTALGSCLAVEEREGELHFSDSGWCRFYPEDGGVLRFEIEGYAPWRWRVPPAKSPEVSIAAPLREAICLGEDLLLRQYAGVRKWVVKIGSQLLSIAPGEWIPQGLGLDAYCVRAEADGLRFLVWDGSGEREEKVEIRILAPTSQQAKQWETAAILELPKEAKVRSKGRLGNVHSCTVRLGKRRILVEEGAWLMRSRHLEAPWLASSWRTLLLEDDIERAIRHKLPGDLIIVDTLRKEEGRILLRGHLFHETHTLMHAFSLILPLEKKPAFEAKSPPTAPAAPTPQASTPSGPPASEQKKRT